MRRLLALGLVLLMAGCGGAGSGGEAPTTASASSTTNGSATAPSTSTVPDTPTVDLADLVASAEPGTVITLDPGDYHLESVLVVDKSLTIEGAGPDRTRLIGRATGAVVAFEGDGHFELMNMTVARDGGSGSIVVIDGGSFVLGHLTISGGVRTGDIGGIGLAVGGPATGDLTNSVVTGNAGTGIALFDDARLTVAATTIKGNGADGILAQDRAAATIDDSEISDNGRSGVHLTSESIAAIRSSAMSSNSEDGVVLFAQSDARIESTRIIDNGIHGLQIGGEASLVVEGCSISGHHSDSDRSDAGIAVVGTTETSILSNEISDNDWGIAVASGFDPLLDGNTFDGNDRDIARDVVFESTSTSTSTSMLSPVLEPGTPYESFAIATDDSGRITVGVPDAWTDRRSGPFSFEGNAVGWSLTVSPDVDALIGGWEVPGIFAGAAPIEIAVEDYLDEYDLSADCDYAGREEYEDPLYRGLMDRWIGCGETGSVMEILVVEPVSYTHLRAHET